MPKFITLCPNCGANNWHQENENVYTGDPGFYICNECEYSSKLFPEVEVSKEKAFSKEAKSGHVHFKVFKTQKLIPSIFMMIIAIVLLFFSWVLFVIVFGIFFTYAALKRIVKGRK